MNVSRTLIAATLIARVRFGPRPGPGRGAQADVTKPQNAPVETGHGRHDRARGSVPRQALPATGPHPGTGKVVLMWHAADSRRRLDRRDRPAAGRPWQAVAKAPSATPHRRAEHRAAPRLSRRPDRPGAGQEVRLSDQPGEPGRLRGRGPRSAGRPTSSNGSSSSATAGPTRPSRRRSPTGRSLSKPHYVMITGDIVYGKGLISEYRDQLLADLQRRHGVALGRCPLLRSTLFLAAPGNHDIASRDLGKTPTAWPTSTTGSSR